jgi:hypothetical protein
MSVLPLQGLYVKKNNLLVPSGLKVPLLEMVALDASGKPLPFVFCLPWVIKTKMSLPKKLFFVCKLTTKSVIITAIKLTGPTPRYVATNKLSRY